MRERRRFNQIPVGTVFSWADDRGVSRPPYTKTGEDYYVDPDGHNWICERDYGIGRRSVHPAAAEAVTASWERLNELWDQDDLGIRDRDGVSWASAPPPQRGHKCWAQTEGVTASGSTIQRCACGGIRFADDHRGAWDGWFYRNTKSDSPKRRLWQW